MELLETPLSEIDLPDELKTFFGSKAGNLLYGQWLAGGALRRVYDGTPYYYEEYDLEADFDIFFMNSGCYTAYVSMLRSEGYTCTKEHEWFQTFVGPEEQLIQCIRKSYFASGWELIRHFDFTCCQIFSDGSSVFTYGEAIDAMCERVLYPTGSLSDLRATLRRMVKYGMYGYEPSEDLLDAVTKRKTFTIEASEVEQQTVNYEGSLMDRMRAALRSLRSAEPKRTSRSTSY